MSQKSEPWIDFSGRICVVTGANGGIGTGLVRAFAALGADIAMIDRVETSGTLEEEVRRAGRKALSLVCDVSDISSVEKAAEQVRSELGGCDILVNNAGLLRPGKLEALDAADWESLIAVNLHGYFHCVQAFGRQMLERKRGALVHVASIAGSQPQAFSGGYSAAKAAVAMMSRQLAFEWGPSGVRSNVVSPGLVRTPLSENFYRTPDVKERREAVVPSRRIGAVEDIADVAVFLASDRAGYVNGQEIVVDGGFSQTLMSHIPRPGYE
ncbi:NAD(P)-dependent dehydrogenase (short-subunit alcohol dehydrogenase family) [Mesorhizobium sp. J18]|uniref:SDR family NAD(P)-dependent oxidoreductase n=1 Tax=Mesorhizobium sp. J18 TaxID=935263 RepID=UPI00119B38AE|nr:SDR family oxidoreductase [Mesorhizobium sp. J18]TWG99505.1 NAD(P)-dependent dehydrogenase (short-subunit alcohol dehydrogenase family) [Mesorhizobium sp. J18]